MASRLSGESSPYLLQHVDNPVDWWPWGEEAFAQARAEDKPVFVSIGYAACHWCHVMAHESFENDDIAKLMNERFINIKVDREERPDVDAVYMNAVHVLGEPGGWPLSVFCDSEGRPFYIGTYFPPTDRHGRPGFPRLLERMAEVYSERRDQVEHNARGVLEGLRQIEEHHRREALSGGVAALEVELIITSGRTLAQRSDPHNGGLGGRPKFPSSSAHSLLGRAGRLRFGEPAREAYLLQAERMAAGGIYDHLGGGFARYSVDERWLVPHFEKMLYDNAQLLSIYADTFAQTGTERYRGLIAETVAWLEREMSDPAGGLYASQDADSEGEEGKFYVWTPAQVREVLGPADSILFCEAYGVTEGGNFEHGTSVLSRVSPIGGDDEEEALVDMRRRLALARAKRIAPETDTKVLAAWNALTVVGLLRAWQVTGLEPARALALRVAEFLAGTMVHDGGARVHRVFKDGTTKLDGTIDDYAFCARAFLAVAECTEEKRWWDAGVKLLESVLERFYEERDGVGIFYMTASDSREPLVHRPESHHDGAIPSGAAVAVEALVRVARMAGHERAREVSENYLAGRAPQAAAQPFAGSELLGALDLYLHGVELVVTEGEGQGELLAAARAAYAPTMMLAGAWAPELVAGKSPAADGRAQAYVCRGQTCAAPTSDPEKLAALVRDPYAQLG